MSSSASARRKPVLYADIEALPEGVVGEIIEGELHVHPRPAPRHALVASRLGALLNTEFDEGMGGQGGWVILDEPEIQLGENILVPDLAGWRCSRLPELPEKGPFVIEPDWVCKVRSPSTANDDRLRKLPIYADHGIGYVWLVDPMVRTIEVLKLSDGKWTLIAKHGDEDHVHAEPFEAAELPLSRLWDKRSAERA
ncbi:MAG: Uma2 family endonuclease [Deltaproteobacteria bacterium]|nr:Uma2 family endonuclease [Deltaproteobacteria bacterium]